MKNVRIELSDESHARLGQEAKAAGYPGISSYLLSKVGVKIKGSVEALGIVQEAHAAITGVGLGVSFELRHLFTDERWYSFPRSARLCAGRLFLNEAKAGIPGLVVVPKRGTNSQMYIRKEGK